MSNGELRQWHLRALSALASYTIERVHRRPPAEIAEIVALARRRRELAIAAAQAADALASAQGRPPWWAPPIASAPAPDHVIAALAIRAKTAAAAAQEAQASFRAAFDGARDASAALGLIHRIVSLSEAALQSPVATLELGPKLEAIADHVVEHWVPGFEPDALFAALTRSGDHPVDDPSPARFERDAVLGWAPIDPAHLRAATLRAMQTAAVAAARATLAKEEREYEEAAQRQRDAQRRLKEARGGQDAGLSSTVQWLEQEAAREGSELTAAAEQLRELVVEALGVFPPMRVYAAALTAAAALCTHPGVVEYAIFDSGQVGARRSSWSRIMLFSALTELRDAADAAFDGLCSACMGIETSRDREGGPYRAAAAAEVQRQEGPGDEVRLFMSLDAAGVPHMLRRGLVHTEMLGIVGRARRASAQKVSLLDRLRFWSEEPSEATEAELAARERWHLDALRTYAQRVHAVVSSAAAAFPVLSIRNGLMVLGVRLDQVRAQATFLVVCDLKGKDEAWEASMAVARAIDLYPYRHPQLAVLMSGVRVLTTYIASISASYDPFRKRCLIEGKPAARHALTQLTANAIACLGRMPSDGELLERYALSRLS